MDIPYYTAKTISPWDPSNPPYEPDPDRPYVVRTTYASNAHPVSPTIISSYFTIGDVVQSAYPIWHGEYEAEDVYYNHVTHGYLGIFVKGEWGLKSTMSVDSACFYQGKTIDQLQIKHLVTLQDPRNYQGDSKYSPGVVLRDDLTVPVHSEVVNLRGNKFVDYISWNYGVYFKENDQFVEDPQYLGSSRRRIRFYGNHYDDQGNLVVEEEAQMYWSPAFIRFQRDFAGGGSEVGDFIIRDVNNPTFASGEEWLAWCKAH